MTIGDASLLTGSRWRGSPPRSHVFFTGLPDPVMGTLMHLEANFSHSIFASVEADNWRGLTEEAPAATPPPSCSC